MAQDKGCGGKEHECSSKFLSLETNMCCFLFVSLFLCLFLCLFAPLFQTFLWNDNQTISNQISQFLGCKIIWRILSIVTLNIQSEPAFLVNLARVLARYLSLLTSDGRYLPSQQQVFIHDCSCFCCRKKWKSGDVSPSLLDGLLIFLGCFQLVKIWEDKTSM